MALFPSIPLPLEDVTVNPLTVALNGHDIILTNKIKIMYKVLVIFFDSKATFWKWNGGNDSFVMKIVSKIYNNGPKINLGMDNTHVYVTV